MEGLQLCVCAYYSVRCVCGSLHEFPSIVRNIPREENLEPSFKIIVKSEYILKACKDVIQTWPGISWNLDPLEVSRILSNPCLLRLIAILQLDPEIFLTFLQEFYDYRDALAAKKARSESDAHLISSVDLLLSTLAADYRTTIATIKQLTSHSEISFGLLYAIFVPRSLIVARCGITGLPRIFKLVSFTRTSIDGKPVYALACESTDLVDRPMSQTVVVGRVQTNIYIPYFKGTTNIASMNAYPIKYHPDEAQLRSAALERGRKWVGLIGVHHKQYSGLAALKCGDKLLRHNVRISLCVRSSTHQCF